MKRMSRRVLMNAIAKLQVRRAALADEVTRLNKEVERLNKEIERLSKERALKEILSFKQKSLKEIT